MPSLHELKRMVRKAVAYRSKCVQCDKRRVLDAWSYCRACQAKP